MRLFWTDPSRALDPASRYCAVVAPRCLAGFEATTVDRIESTASCRDEAAGRTCQIASVVRPAFDAHPPLAQTSSRSRQRNASDVRAPSGAALSAAQTTGPKPRASRRLIGLEKLLRLGVLRFRDGRYFPHPSHPRSATCQ